MQSNGRPATNLSVSNEKHKQDQYQTTKTLSVIDGSSRLILPTERVACFFVLTGHILVRTFDINDYVCEYTLDELEAVLSPFDFFRVNRQVIANRQSCRSCEQIEHGKIILTLSLSAPVPTVISQWKTPLFKDWIQMSNA